MTCEEAEKYLLDIAGYTTKNTLENTKAYMQYLSEHTDTLYKGRRVAFDEMPGVIHVAGTNGKGSVCAFLNGILIKAGCKTGMFTSPHLVRMTERFQINGVPVSGERFAEVCEQVRVVVQEGIAAGCFVHPTFFEFLTGMAFVLFQQENVDVLILETGLGGLKDATNFVKKPLASVITTIGVDHTEFLGETLEEITLQKAGIIKPGVPVIFDAENTVVNALIERRAEQLQAPVYQCLRNKYEILCFDKKNIDFLWKSEYYNDMRIRLETSALYQVQNAALAALTIECIDEKHRIPPECIREGIRQTKWQGRMEWLTQYILMDGAHNENGMEQALCTLEKLDVSVILLYSAVKDKNFQAIIQMICKRLRLSCVIVTQLDTPRAVVTEELAGNFRCHFSGEVYEKRHAADALRLAKELWQEADAGKENTIIFATGSLYLVGALKQCVTEQK